MCLVHIQVVYVINRKLCQSWGFNYNTSKYYTLELVKTVTDNCLYFFLRFEKKSLYIRCVLWLL